MRLRGNWKIKSLFLTLFATAFLGGSTAHAASIIQSQTVPLTDTDFTAPLMFNQFNPANGTLTSIRFTIDGQIATQFEATNQGSDTATVEFDVTATLTLKRPDASTISALGLSFNLVEELDPGEFFQGSGGDSDSLLEISPPPASDLALFTGLGTITLDLTAEALSSVEFLNGNGDGFIATQAGATVRLEYVFEENVPVIPEPASLAIFGIAGVGMFFFRRFQRRFDAS